MSTKLAFVARAATSPLAFAKERLAGRRVSAETAPPRPDASLGAKAKSFVEKKWASLNDARLRAAEDASSFVIADESKEADLLVESDAYRRVRLEPNQQFVEGEVTHSGEDGDGSTKVNFIVARDFDRDLDMI